MEVYWQAPDRSKQVISGWRDGAFLPTDIHYHRDHLGIVTNDFGDVIRIGEGDEVRDVPHPLSPAGPDGYDYALGDSLVIRTGTGAIRVRRVEVRPKDFGRPMVVGTLYLDAETAALVRFRFSFTPAAYLDRQLEDISIVLENGRFEGRYWLPYRQDVEIRRRTTWLDFPARGIIRARWEIGDYDLNPALPPSTFTGVPIGGLHAPEPDTGQWTRAARRRDGRRGPTGDRTGHGRAPGGGRADRRGAGAERAAGQPAGHRLGERPRQGEPGPGSRPRHRRECSACRSGGWSSAPRSGMEPRTSG